MDRLITKKWIVPKSHVQCPQKIETTVASSITTISNPSKVSYDSQSSISNASISHESRPIPSSQNPILNSIRTYSKAQATSISSAPHSTGAQCSSKPMNPNSIFSSAIESSISCGSSASTFSPSSQKLASSALRSSDFTSKAEYRNVNINGKVMAIKVMKVSQPYNVPRNSGSNIGTKRNQNIPKDLRDISTLKLDSFTKKRAEFLVLPKSDKSSVNHHTNSVPVPCDAEIPEIPEIEPNTNAAGDEIDMGAETREIRKSQEEILAYVKRLNEDTHRRALSLPVDTKAEIDKIESLIRGKGFRKKLFESLQKRVSRTKKDEVVAELISYIFTPDVLNQFNVTGTQAKNAKVKRTAFANLRINQVIKVIDKLDTDLYDLQLTKAIHMMHMRFTRKEAENRLRELVEEASTCSD